MKIAAGGADEFEVDLRGPELLGYEVDHALLHLEGAGDTQERSRFCQNGVALEDAVPDHQVHEAGLVIQCHEHHAAGGAGALAADHLPA